MLEHYTDHRYPNRKISDFKIAVIGKGAVGSTISKILKSRFISHDSYDSSNIETSFDKRYDLMIYAGVNASKYIADSDPFNDRLHCLRAFEIFKDFDSDYKILISTIDASDKFEDRTDYGLNRRMLEKMVLEECDVFTSSIIRLPALYGSQVKKNTWYDCVRGAESVELNNDFKTKIIDEIGSSYDASKYNILSFVSKSSVFCWYDLDTILSSIWRSMKMKDRLIQVVSYDDNNKNGLVMTHKEMLDQFGYEEVEELQCSSKRDYRTALIDTDCRLMFEKSKNSIFNRVVSKGDRNL